MLNGLKDARYGRGKARGFEDVSRFEGVLEYQLQLGLFLLNKNPTKVGTLNTAIEVGAYQS